MTIEVEVEGHLADDELVDLRAGRLDAVRRTAVLQHLDSCEMCVTLVSALDVAPTEVSALRAMDFGTRFDIETELGRGGMGQVLLATDRLLGRQVALKISREARSTWRLSREVAITARLQHPGIIAVYDAGTLEGHPCYAMRPIAGTSLAAKLAATEPRPELRLPLVPALAAATEAIAYAHSVGVIHRDLTPANIMLGEFGETVVIDWGVARMVDGDEPPGPAGEPAVAGTSDGAVIGTPMYMAPEQARGDRVDRRSDVYALGCVLFQIVTGRMPWDVPAPQVVAALLHGERFPIRGEMPAELEAIVRKATAVDPAERYPDAAALAAELRRYLGGRLVEAHRYTAWGRLRRWIGRNKLVAATGAIALVVVIVIGLIAVRQVIHERDRAEVERARAAAERESAEELLAHVAEDLPDRLRPIGQLDLLDDTAARIAHYFRRVLVGRADAATRLQLVRALLLNAETTSARTQSAASQQLEDEAAATLAATPASPERDVLLAELTARRSGLAEERGEAPLAKELGADALRQLRALPSTPEVEDMIGAEECHLATLLMYEGDFAMAAKRLAAAGVAMDAAGDFPDANHRAQWRSVLDFETGQLAWLSGRLDEAAVHLEQARARLAAVPASAMQTRNSMVHILESLAMVELYRGNTDDAAKLEEKILETWRAAMLLDPTDRDSRNSMITTLSDLASIEIARDRMPAATAVLVEGMALAETALAEDPRSSILLQHAVIMLGSLVNEVPSDPATRAKYIVRDRELADRLVEVDPGLVNRCRRALVELFAVVQGGPRAAEAAQLDVADRFQAALPPGEYCSRNLAIDIAEVRRAHLKKWGTAAEVKAVNARAGAVIESLVKDRQVTPEQEAALRKRFPGDAFRTLPGRREAPPGGRGSPGMTRPRWLIPLLVVFVTLAADQGSKAWARDALTVGDPVPVVDGFWDWELAYNPGAAFSTFEDGTMRVLLSIIGIGATLVIGWMLSRAKPEQRAQRWGLALIAGGAVGNLMDRIGTGLVTDFVRWRWNEHRWPIFNVADAALLIGAALLVIDGWRRRGATLASDG